MAVLRTEDGGTYVRHEAINDVIAPTRIDPVPVPPGLGRLLAPPELTPAEIDALVVGGDPTLEDERAGAGWPPALAQVLFPGMPQALEDMLAGFGPPHTNPVDEIHYVLDGAVLFGVVLAGGAQALAVIQPGDALRIFEGTEHWSTLTTDHRVKTILYLSRPPGYAHAYTGTKIRITS